MATRKSSSTRTTNAPAAPSILPHERQAEAQEAVATIQYGLRLTAVLMRAPGQQEYVICGVEIAHTVRALVGSMEQAASRIGRLLVPEPTKDAEAREAALRG